MSLRNESGQIVINEKEANDDIANLKKSRQSLEDFRKSLTNAKSKLNAAWMGDSYTSFSRKTDTLVKDVDKVISQINASIKNIEDTVRHYKEVDKQLTINTQKSLDAIKKITGGLK